MGLYHCEKIVAARPDRLILIQTCTYRSIYW